DYADPAGPALTLALARKPARTPAARIGSLLINPGGPGDSGVDDLPAELRSLTATLQNRFDIVSWDPRGVERGAPVHCSAPTATRPARCAAPSTPTVTRSTCGPSSSTGRSTRAPPSTR